MKNLILGILIALGVTAACWIGLLLWFDGERLERIGKQYLSRQTGLTARIEEVTRTIGLVPAVRQCGGRLRVIACIEQPEVIDRILGHLGRVAGAVGPGHPSRAPPERPRLI